MSQVYDSFRFYFGSGKEWKLQSFLSDLKASLSYTCELCLLQVGL
jgi:hypothetical protein